MTRESQCRIEIIAVGDELTRGRELDKNSAYIGKQLHMLGLSTQAISVVRDDASSIAEKIISQVYHVDLFIITGGLGPTPDDITRFAVSLGTGRELTLYKDELKTIHRKLRNVDKKLRETASVQAYFPEGSVPINNPIGIAPGFILEWGKTVIICLPGVPREVHSIFDTSLRAYLQQRFDAKEPLEKILKTVGMREAQIYLKIKKYLDDRIKLGMYPRGGEVELRIGAAHSHAKRFYLVYKEIVRALKDVIYNTEDVSIEQTVGNILARKKLTIACAESCTGGTIAQRITNCPGSSRYFRGAVVSYSSKIKTEFLNVPKEMLERYGSVSPQVCRAMLKGLIEKTDADIGISVTGVAGPSGGTKKKPVGLVYIGVCYKGTCSVRKYNLRGDRNKIRWLASQIAFSNVWKCIR